MYMQTVIARARTGRHLRAGAWSMWHGRGGVPRAPPELCCSGMALGYRDASRPSTGCAPTGASRGSRGAARVLRRFAAAGADEYRGAEAGTGVSENLTSRAARARYVETSAGRPRSVTTVTACSGATRVTIRDRRCADSRRSQPDRTRESQGFRGLRRWHDPAKTGADSQTRHGAHMDLSWISNQPQDLAPPAGRRRRR